MGELEASVHQCLGEAIEGGLTFEEFRASLAETVSSLHPAGLPIAHAYRVEIPAGWRALQPFFYQEPVAWNVSGLPDTHAAAAEGLRMLRVAILLCRQEADDAQVLQEFADGVGLEAAYLNQDGQYLQGAQRRPAFGVLRLAEPTSSRQDRGQHGECLVLLPLVTLPFTGEEYAPVRMFVDGVEVLFDPLLIGGAA